MSEISVENITLKAAQIFLTKEWRPVPVPLRKKGPVIGEWQNMRLTASDLPKYFPANSNIGLILGEPSGGLVDVDLDTPQAVRAASVFLPETQLTHGRKSKRSSHWWYVSTHPIPTSKRFVAPDGTCLLELRSTGEQTVVPPSIHPSGEDIAWEKNGPPAQVDSDVLINAVAQLAASVLLGKAWPKQPGNRQQVAMAVAGFLLRNGLQEEVASKLIGVSAQLAGDEEYRKRAVCVRDTAKALKEGKNVIGGPNIATLLADGSKVVELLSNWLQLKTASLPQNWATPELFDDYTGPAFPSNVFPGILNDFVKAQADALQVPVDLVATLAIGVGAAAAAGRCTVRLHKEWAEPLNIFAAVVLPSGERKSPTFKVITEPLEEREKSLLEAYRPEIETQKAEHDILETQLQAAKTAAAKAKVLNRNVEEMKEVITLSEKLANHKIDKPPRFIADDATSESVASLLTENGGRMAIMSTEGGLFETLAGRYSSGVPNIDVYLKGYSGDPLRVDRKSRPPEFVPNPALTVCMTVQPSVICDSFARPMFRGRGLLARFLYSLPKSKVGYRSIKPVFVPDNLREDWHNGIMAILKLAEPQPGEEHAMQLSPEADAIFEKFREEAERRLRREGDLSGIADWGNKFPGNVARLAGILHLLGNAQKTEPWKIPISASTIESAIKIGDYYAQHALAAYGLMGADPKMELGRRLWAIIVTEKLTQFSLRDIYQNKRKSFPISELLTASAVLVRMGYIRPNNATPSGKAGRPASPAFDVNPLTGTQNTHNPQNVDATDGFEDSGDCGYCSEDTDTVGSSEIKQDDVQPAEDKEWGEI